VLVNNAGVMACPEQYIAQGWRCGSPPNHLGHFALATGLHDALAADGSARIVVVSSTGHQVSPVVFDDVNFAFRPYDPWLAYGQSKTANVLFAVGAIRRWAADGITPNALMPDAAYTNVPKRPRARTTRASPARRPARRRQSGSSPPGRVSGRLPTAPRRRTSAAQRAVGVDHACHHSRPPRGPRPHFASASLGQVGERLVVPGARPRGGRGRHRLPIRRQSAHR
jgi:NAD(P)-dependent dehydrogenase (short-subunit alcohol dehydrogenase family)